VKFLVRNTVATGPKRQILRRANSVAIGGKDGVIGLRSLAEDFGCCASGELVVSAPVGFDATVVR